MKKLLLTTLTLTFLLMVWGGLVRGSGAGLACPDWPLCHGEWIPPLEPLILLEWGHRLIASVVGWLTLVLVILVFKNPEYRKRVGGLTFLAFVLLLLQAVLGGMTVLAALTPLLVTVHLGVGFLFFGLLLWIYLKLKYQEEEMGQHPSLSLGFGFMTLWVYVQILLGGWVAANHAGLACPDFPTCFGEWMPSLQGLVAYQMLHRWMAFGILALGLALVWMCRKTPWKKRVRGILAVVLVQTLLGVANVIWELPLAIRVFHLALALVLYVKLFLTWYQVQHVRVS